MAGLEKNAAGCAKANFVQEERDGEVYAVFSGCERFPVLKGSAIARFCLNLEQPIHGDGQEAIDAAVGTISRSNAVLCYWCDHYSPRPSETQVLLGASGS